jgi:copper chaperone CopZ
MMLSPMRPEERIIDAALKALQKGGYAAQLVAHEGAGAAGGGNAEEGGWYNTLHTVVVLEVEGLATPHKCVMDVQHALEGVIGVRRAVVDFSSRLAIVSTEKELATAAEVTALEARLVGAVDLLEISSYNRKLAVQAATAADSGSGSCSDPDGREVRLAEFVLEVSGMECMKACGAAVHNAITAVRGLAILNPLSPFPLLSSPALTAISPIPPAGRARRECEAPFLPAALSRPSRRLRSCPRPS